MVSKLLTGLGVTFALPMGEIGELNYYLEYTESISGQHSYFPPEGPDSPFSYFAVESGPEQVLEALPFGVGRPPDGVLTLPWGSLPGQAGISYGNESAQLGPAAIAVREDGHVWVMDQFNDRLQRFNTQGVLQETVTYDLGPVGDLELTEDSQSLYALDTIPAVGESPLVHLITPSGAGTAPPTSATTTSTLEEEPVLLRAVEQALFVYGTPSDMWTPVPGHSPVSSLKYLTGMPSVEGEIGRRVVRSRGLSIVNLNTHQDLFQLRAPQDRLFGELALVEPDGVGGFWVVVRTWQEEPALLDHHEVIHLSNDGQIENHFAVENSEYAEAGSLSQFSLGKDGRLYQMWSDDLGLQVRRFNL